MGGLHVFCGDYAGEDKAVSAFSGVMEEMKFNCIEPAALKLVTRLFDETDRQEEEITISSAEAAILLPELKEFRKRLEEKLGGVTDPELAFATGRRLDEKAGIDPTEAKYGKGLAWQHMCALEMIEACEHSIRNGDEVMVCYI